MMILLFFLNNFLISFQETMTSSSFKDDFSSSFLRTMTSSSKKDDFILLFLGIMISLSSLYFLDNFLPSFLEMIFFYHSFEMIFYHPLGMILYHHLRNDDFIVL